MKNVVAYCRVSTDGQVGEDKFGIDAQKEQIMEYCSKNDMQISAWYIDEGVSGATEERPEFDKILYADGEVSNPPVEAVVVAKSDRIARDINIYYYYKMLLRKKEIQLISVAEDFGQLGVFASMLEAFTLCVAEMERQNIVKRTSGGRAVKAARGGYSGGKPPFGYKAQNGELVIVDSEVEIVKKIFELRRSEKTYREIVRYLNDNNVPSRCGNGWAISTLQAILGNEKLYQGYYKYGKGGDWVKGVHKAILDE